MVSNMVVASQNDTMTISEFKQLIEDSKKQGINTIPITIIIEPDDTVLMQHRLMPAIMETSGLLS